MPEHAHRLPALVLTAGLGTRLRPLSYVRAKPAVPVAGEPLVGRLLRWLRAWQVEDLVLNLHHLPDTITSIVGDGSPFGVRVRYSWEPRILGSAGGPRRALPLLDARRFFLVNGDTLSNVDLERLATAHATSGALVTLAVIPNPAPERYGGVTVADDGVITGFSRRGERRDSYHFVGVQVAEAETFAGLPDGEPAESVGGLYRTLIGARPGSVRAFVSSASFDDIGTPADYLRTSLALAAAEGLAGLPGGRGSTMARTATVVRTAVWDNVRVDDRADLLDCVLTDGVHVPPGFRGRRLAITKASGRLPGPGETLDGDLLIAPIED